MRADSVYFSDCTTTRKQHSRYADTQHKHRQNADMRSNETIVCKKLVNCKVVHNQLSLMVVVAVTMKSKEI